MKAKLLLSTLSILALTFSFNGFACTFDGNQTFAGTLTPTAAYQTQGGICNGQYFTFNVTCGDTYNFNFCNNGGSAAWDTQITILNVAGTVEFAYNDDACGLQSDVTWTAGGTGTAVVLVSQYSCDNTGGSCGATMAYNVTPGAQNPAFTMASTGCASASATITGDTGGTFAFNPAPGDAAVIDANTGAIINGTPGATYTVEYTVSCGVSSTQNVTLDNSGTPTFTMSVICGGGAATVTGSTGGTFAFNPAPGDGAQINSFTGTVSNGTAGTTYFVEYTVCGSSSIQSVTVLTDNCWTLNGNSQWITVNNEDCIQLTDAVNNQTGCAWNGTTIDFANDFTLTLDYYFGANINGADGNTFTFQTSSSTACGSAGGGLGAGGIPNALVVEFDTYDNDFPAHVYDMSCDHIAVEIDGSMSNAAPLCGPVCAKAGGGNIDDGNVYQVDIAWNATTQDLEIYFDGNLRLTCNNDFVTNAFSGTSQVYWGATSATGGLNNQQYFCPNTVVILPVVLGSFESECIGKEEVFEWTTVTEQNTDYFQLEYTYDGLVFLPVETVDATGNTEDEMSYSARVKNEDDKQRYYRLKIVDEDGNLEYTDLIASKACATSSTLIHSNIVTENGIVISTSDDAEIKLMNQLGQVVFVGETSANILTIDKSILTNGIYYIIAESSNGIQESSKVFVSK